MSVSPQCWKPQSGWILVAALLAAACAVLYVFDPSRHAFYPRCPLHEWTGLACPGCGSLRAMHQLLHGHLRAAFAFNPLLVSILPFILWQMGERLYRGWRGKEPRELFPSAWSGWAAFVVVLGFAVLRNLPFFPFPKV